MPYIKDKKTRKNLEEAIFAFIGSDRDESYDWITGKLNYFLFSLAKKYCRSYRDFRDFIGELESAKLEIYRKLVAKYEDKKIEENGDVK